jgi:transcriptional regulator with XRE-family HTH domain
MEQILKNIKEIRLKKGYSQEYISTKIGMKQGSYGLIETGKRGLSYQTLLQIAEALEMDVCDIIKYNRDTPIYREKVYIQIEVEKEAKEQVLNIIYGNNNLKISNG